MSTFVRHAPQVERVAPIEFVDVEDVQPAQPPREDLDRLFVQGTFGTLEEVQGVDDPLVHDDERLNPRGANVEREVPRHLRRLQTRSKRNESMTK